MKYRREIDGLRAVAVMPVILFHAGLGVFSGGYVGVDVFFVISGYLITLILISDIETRQFSLTRFYERRARRILPALFFVIAACLPFAYLWMLPDQLKDFSESIVAVMFFGSNFLFWQESGYFAAAAELKPLLHTWSLAVEEQYYLLFPLFLLWCWRLGRRSVFWAIVALAVVSFALAEWGWRHAPGAAFYLAPTRAWELLTGSICAFLSAGRPQRSSNGLSALGLALIMGSIFWFDATTPFPSVYTLVPVVGSALVILYAAPGTWAGRLLSLPGFVGIGLISYSAYLWHQPLFAFARLRSIDEPSHLVMAALALAALLLAWGTWRFVEQPFRRQNNRLLPARRSVFMASGVASLAFLAIGAAGHLGDGFEGRLGDKDRAIIARSQPDTFRCDGDEVCLLGDRAGTSSGIAFVGDSHMGRYAHVLDGVFDARGQNARVITRGWCAPLLDWNASVVRRCGGPNGEKFQSELRDILQDSAIHTVVLAAQWANYTTGYRHGWPAIAYDYAGDALRNADVSRNPAEFAGALDHTIGALERAGKRIIVIAPVPEYTLHIPQVALHLSRFGGAPPEGFEIGKPAYLERNAAVFRSFEDHAARMTLIDVWPLLCDAALCRPVSEDGLPLYQDENHLLREGMTGIVGALVQHLDL